ncbi:hypothetical protein [Streptomyces sp. CA-111067]|uniref:hypothetical protein n=1 Tax=Streptomyces sp. CA-111067 TaxID=3240046 RepID=UPI003D98098B
MDGDVKAGDRPAEEPGVGPDARKPQGDPDVLLDIPDLHVDEIDLDVQDLRARVALHAEVLDLLKLDVGVDVVLGRVELDVTGVQAQALLKVRLDNVAEIVGSVLRTIDRNPQILEQVTRPVGEAVQSVGSGAGRAVGELGRGAGEAVEDVGEGAGEAVEDVAEGAGQAVEEVGSGAGEAVEEVGSGAGEAVEEVGSGAGEAVEDVGSGVGEAAGEVGSGAGEAVDDISASASTALGDEEIERKERAAETAGSSRRHPRRRPRPAPSRRTASARRHQPR